MEKVCSIRIQVEFEGRGHNNEMRYRRVWEIKDASEVDELTEVIDDKIKEAFDEIVAKRRAKSLATVPAKADPDDDDTY